MRFRKSQLALTVATSAAVLALALTLLVSRGVINTLLIVVVAVLAGMYMLRGYARAELLYRRRAEQHRERERADSMLTSGREDATNAGAASTAPPGPRA